MDLRALFLWMLVIFFLSDVVGAPIKFPDDTGREIGESRSYLEGDPKFHHHRKKKQRKKKKLGCLLALHHSLHKSANPSHRSPDGRTFLFAGLNIYDTDIHVVNPGYKPIRPSGGHGGGNPCGGSGVGEVIGGVGGLLGGIGGGGGNGGGGNGGDNGGDDGDDEDYDYSDGPGTSNNNGGNSGIGQGISNLSSLVGSAPGTVTSVIGSIGNGIRPIFERPERYFDYYVIRPINRSLRQFVSWF